MLLTKIKSYEELQGKIIGSLVQHGRGSLKAFVKRDGVVLMLLLEFEQITPLDEGNYVLAKLCNLRVFSKGKPGDSYRGRPGYYRALSTYALVRLSDYEGPHRYRQVRGVSQIALPGQYHNTYNREMKEAVNLLNKGEQAKAIELIRGIEFMIRRHPSARLIVSALIEE